eukprot:2484942-Prymnesium_polylepis.1
MVCDFAWHQLFVLALRRRRESPSASGAERRVVVERMHAPAATRRATLDGSQELVPVVESQTGSTAPGGSRGAVKVVLTLDCAVVATAGAAAAAPVAVRASLRAIVAEG